MTYIRDNSRNGAAKSAFHGERAHRRHVVDGDDLRRAAVGSTCKRYRYCKPFVKCADGLWHGHAGSIPVAYTPEWLAERGAVWLVDSCEMSAGQAARLLREGKAQ